MAMVEIPPVCVLCGAKDIARLREPQFHANPAEARETERPANAPLPPGKRPGLERPRNLARDRGEYPRRIERWPLSFPTRPRSRLLVTSDDPGARTGFIL
jgi:hypothetical protein